MWDFLNKRFFVATSVAVIIIGFSASFVPLPGGQGSLVRGGRDAYPNEFPFQVSLYLNDEFLCGGAALNEKWILTAGHCVEKATAGSIIVRGGSIVLSKGEPRRVKKLFLAPGYGQHPTLRDWKKHDLALLELEIAFDTERDGVRGIGASSPLEEPALLRPAVAQVAGWGTWENDLTSQKLRVAPVATFSPEACRPMQVPGAVLDTMLCAGSEASNHCEGDSGGPLFAGPIQSRKVIGVASRADGCYRGSKPGIHTRVSAFYGWITKCISGDACS